MKDSKKCDVMFVFKGDLGERKVSHTLYCDFDSENEDFVIDWDKKEVTKITKVRSNG